MEKEFIEMRSKLLQEEYGIELAEILCKSLTKIAEKYGIPAEVKMTEISKTLYQRLEKEVGKQERAEKIDFLLFHQVAISLYREEVHKMEEESISADEMLDALSC